MPHFKDTTNKVHFLDDAAYVHLLPAGSVEITDEEAAQLNYRAPTTEELNAPILAQLAVIDQKKVRAMTDGILKNDKQRLQQLEDEAEALRLQLV